MEGRGMDDGTWRPSMEGRSDAKETKDEDEDERHFCDSNPNSFPNENNSNNPKQKTCNHLGLAHYNA